MSERKITFRLGKPNVVVDTYTDSQFENLFPLLRAMRDGVKQVGGTVEVTKFEEATEEL